MMKTNNHSRFFRHMFGSVCIAALVVSCTSNASGPSTTGSEPEPMPQPGSPPDAGAMAVDPTGNWDLNYMILPGCGEPASTAMDTFTVTRTPNGYLVSAGSETVTGTLNCTPSNCKLSAVFAWADTSLQYQQSTNMVLDARNGITGNGTVSFTDGTTACSLTFTVTGSKI